MPSRNEIHAHKQRQGKDAPRASQAAAAKPKGRGKGDGYTNNQNKEKDLVRKLQAENAQLRKQQAGTGTPVQEEDDEQDDETDELAEWIRQEIIVKKQLALPGQIEAIKALHRNNLAHIQQRRVELEIERDKAKPHSSKVQRAEAEERKAKQHRDKIASKLEAAEEALVRQMANVRQLQAEKAECEKAVSDAARQVDNFKQCQPEEQQHGGISPELVGLLRAKAAPEIWQAFEAIIREFRAAQQEQPPPTAAPTTSAASPSTPKAEPAADEQAPMEDTAAVEPGDEEIRGWMLRQPKVPEEVDEPTREAYQKAKAEWLETMPAVTCAKRHRKSG